MIVAAENDAVRPKLAPSGDVPGDQELPWQAEMKRAIRDPAELCRRLSLPESIVTPARRAAATFPLFVPEPYLRRMAPGDPADPLLRQVLPLDAELADVPGYVADAVGDLQAQRTAGLLQKYAGRALLIATGACAIHCRYCFRRHFPYASGPRGIDAWQPALDEIAADRTIDEVILSGGDPLTLSDAFLAALVERVAAIDHIQRLRVHTRLPIVIPQRVTDELLGWLCASRLTPVVVVHANHAAELDEATAVALARLADAGVPLLNQAVLLAGVNDRAAALAELCRRLVNLRVMPYYLHRLDPVAGAAHFNVPLEKGLRLVEHLRRVLPGYAVPRFVEETPGAASKLPLG